MPSALQNSVAAMTPKVSLSSVAMAPPMRAMPETRCWLEISRTAVVNDMPGIRMIRLASTTDLIASGTMKALTRIATMVATSALIASLAAASCGRTAAARVMQPMIVPITAATTRSTHELCRNSAAIEAADKP